LVGLLVRSPVADRGRVENDSVGEVAFFQQASAVESQICRGQMAELADRCLEGQ
jgi:hypothetical protein